MVAQPTLESASGQSHPCGQSGRIGGGMGEGCSPRGMSSSVVIRRRLSSSGGGDVDIFAARSRHDVVMSRRVVVIRIRVASPTAAMRRKSVGLLSQIGGQCKIEPAPWKLSAIEAPVASDENRQLRQMTVMR